jgi:hypothetical protein
MLRVNANSVQLNLFAYIHISTWNHIMEFSNAANYGRIKEFPASLIFKALSLSNAAFATCS